MKTLRVAVATMFAVLLIGALPAAAQEAEEAAAPSALLSASGAFGFPGETWEGQSVPGATSTYTAHDEGITATFDTNGLIPGHVVTMWWVIFNHPEACVHGEGGFRCGEPDLLIMGGDEAVAGTVLNAGGHIVGPDGAGHFDSFLVVGDTDGVMIDGPGLTNPLGADVHLVLRDHGPVQPGIFVDQLSTYGGGCTEAPDGTGTLGDFVCTQPQFAVHEPALRS